MILGKTSFPQNQRVVQGYRTKTFEKHGDHSGDGFSERRDEEGLPIVLMITILDDISKIKVEMLFLEVFVVMHSERVFQGFHQSATPTLPMRDDEVANIS